MLLYKESHLFLHFKQLYTFFRPWNKLRLQAWTAWYSTRHCNSLHSQQMALDITNKYKNVNLVHLHNTDRVTGGDIPIPRTFHTVQ